jgi:hypothetical protein
MSSRFSVIVVATAFAGALQGQQQSATPRGEPVSGISCDAMEGAKMHIHQHLTIIDHGHPVVVPPDVGRPGSRDCLYWLHTHRTDGILHVESPTERTFTLGDFFSVWGQPLSHAQVAGVRAGKGASLRIWVNGKRYAGDPRKIPLTQHADIVIESGPPFPKPPVFTSWGPL